MKSYDLSWVQSLLVSIAAFPIEHAFDILQRPVVEAAAYAPQESEALLALLGEAAANRSPATCAILAGPGRHPLAAD